MECHFQGASLFDNIDAWKWKLTTLLRDKDKQELVSREKKDRRDYEDIAALASQMGLYRYLQFHVTMFTCDRMWFWEHF